MAPFDGTPLCSWTFRLLGATIGSNNVMIGAKLYEADLVEIGDNCVLKGSIFSTHVFEDRLLKFGNIAVGDGCKIQGVIQRNCTLADNTTLGVGSLMVQNESTAPNSVYIGHMAFPVELQAEVMSCQSCPASVHMKGTNGFAEVDDDMSETEEDLENRPLLAQSASHHYR
jgi:hypothetical protein